VFQSAWDILPEHWKCARKTTELMKRLIPWWFIFMETE